ncbi:MAG: hypothetical protein K0R17_3504, partial [Rariglobus sp.]|nr:hypothetical protein [Rariglobus sp.]
LIAREGWIYQDIKEEGTTIFQDGNANYDTTRFNIELDQPLYDPTINPQIDAAKARRRQALSRGHYTSEVRTRQVVEGFLRAVRFNGMVQSTDRVIARLEKESAKVTQSHDVKIATVSDVQNIRLALVAARRERNNYLQQLHRELASLSVSADVLKDGWIKLDPAAGPWVIASTTQEATPATVTAGGTPETEGLQAEIDEVAHQATVSRRRSWPVLSLYTQYALDNAGGSVFGGSRELQNYEVGVAVKWDIFDRGINRSEAKEFTFRQRAKEAELKALQGDLQKAEVHSRQYLDQATASVGELAELVKQYEALKDTSVRSYEAGKESYMNSITAYLAYESAAREWAGAQHDQLLQQVVYEAQVTGWDAGLVDKVDALFVAKK